MSLRETLVAARKLIARGWIQGVSARTRDGHVTFAQSANACAWCTVGALASVTENDREYGEAVESLKAAALVPPRGSIVGWNDRPQRTQSEVLAVFDRAIAACEVA